MPGRVKLTVQSGHLEGVSYIFQERKQCLLGRASDCEIQLPATPEHRAISRHHCLFDIDPPHLWVRDLGSRNGTFVNERPSVAQEPVELHEGDEVRTGQFVLKVHCEEPESGHEQSQSSFAAAEWIT